EFFENGFEYVHSAAKFLIAFVAMLYFAPLFGLIAIGFGVLIVIVIFKFDKHYIATLQQVNEREHTVSSNLFDSLSNIITVITLRLEKRMEKGLMKKVDDIRPPYGKNIRINEWKWFVVDTLVLFIYIVILVGYVYQNYVPGEVFLIGTLVTVMSYVDRFTSVFHNVAWLYTGIVRRHTDVAAADNILEAYAKLGAGEKVQHLPKGWHQIEVEELSFSHQQESTEAEDKSEEHEAAEPADSPADTLSAQPATILDAVSIRIRKGQKIALIGESGSGKSTLLALLRGLYQPQAVGQIRVDEATVSKLSVISNKVTLFPQEPEIFENTISYNITLGLPFGKSQIEEVCASVQFTEVVSQLPKGLESNIQEKGVNLSGGQKQRLALARGVFAAQESDIILLDEPTSSVDPMTELKIYDQLFERFADKAIVSALHRLHLLSRFDYVYVMQDGKVVDEGSFADLRKHSVVFQELWRHQEESGVGNGLDPAG
ncbi:MAG: ABC transporter ATP-binding protein, partial [Bacteroidota bacterium]